MAGTLKIVAERAGLSQSTVSQILNRRPNDFSSEETRQRVFAIASELGYKQNFGHKVLRGDKTHTVAILLGMHRLSLEEHIQELIIMLLDKFEQRNYASYLITLSETAAGNMRKIRDLISRGVDGFVAIGAPHGQHELEKEILKQGKTVIGYNTSMHRNVYQNVSTASEKIMRFFLAEGRANFKVLLGRDPEQERMQALYRVFPDLSHGTAKERYYVSLGDLGEHNDIDLFSRIGYEKTREVMAKDPSIQALYYLNDYFALGGVKYLFEHGYAVGKDVAVGGFNNINAVRNHVFPISSGKHNLEKISDILVGEADKTGHLNKMIEPEPIIRK